MSYSRDTVYRVWDDVNGTRYEVCEDADALGCCEIRYVDDAGKICDRILLPMPAAKLLLGALSDFLSERKL